MAAATELDFALASFWEFARIWRAGRNCKLVLSCDHGHGEVQLVAGLGAAEEQHFRPQEAQVHRYERKKTPSQLRREERRRNERKTEKAFQVAEQAREAVLDEQPGQKDQEAAEQATDDDENENIVSEANPDARKEADIAGIAVNVSDEVCPDHVFNNQEEEESADVQVEKILVEADCQADWKDDYVIKLVNDKLMMIGIKMKSIQVNRNIRKCFESCVVMIEPTRKEFIEQQTFPIRRWTMKCIL